MRIILDLFMMQKQDLNIYLTDGVDRNVVYSLANFCVVNILQKTLCWTPAGLYEI